MANAAYQNIYYKLKRRDAKIVKLKETIESLKLYIAKIGNRSRQRKLRSGQLLVRLRSAERLNQEVIRFIRRPFDKRLFNLTDMMIRVIKTLELFNEISYKELYLLLYLTTVDSASSKVLIKELGVSKAIIYKLVFDLGNDGLLISNRVSSTNYVYITEQGRVVVKNFLETMKKQTSVTI